MKDLLDRIRVMDRKPAEGEVDSVLQSLGGDVSIALLEQALEKVKASRKDIVTGELLEWMSENDQTTFETEDLKVTVKPYVSAKIEEINEQKAFKWLEDHGYGDLIKDTLSLGKGEFSTDVAAALEELGVSYTKKSGIHYQSLKKVMMDRLKASEDFPSEEDGITVTHYNECEVKAR